jgi:hypothetical protein
MILDILTAIVLILHGPYSIYAGIRNKPLIAQVFDSDFYLEKKIIGASFNTVYNIIFGIIELLFGILILSHLK